MSDQESVSNSPSQETFLSQILSLTQQMLEAAHSKDWQRLSELEASRKSLLKSLFAGSRKDSQEDIDEAMLTRVYHINQQVFDLVKQTRNMTIGKIRDLEVGRKAIRVYDNNKPLF